MGNKSDICTCYKHSEDTSIEVELKSGERRKIKILRYPHKFSINKKETQKVPQIVQKHQNFQNYQT